MFSTAPGTSLLARAAASYQKADTDESAVDGVPAAVESYTTDNSRHSLDYLGKQQENERQIDNGYDEQNHVGYPLTRFGSDRHLDTRNEADQVTKRNKVKGTYRWGQNDE